MKTTDSHSTCIEACQRCHDTCLKTIHHCLRRGGAHAGQPHIRLMADCIEICQTSANFMLRGSDLRHLTCGVCAEICERCAADCERLAGDDERMHACAEACRACARSCREMSGQRVVAADENGQAAPAEGGGWPADGSTADEIGKLAQHLFEEAGRPSGRDQDFWLQAESLLRSRGGELITEESR